MLQDSIPSNETVVEDQTGHAPEVLSRPIAPAQPDHGVNEEQNRNNSVRRPTRKRQPPERYGNFA